MASPLVYDATVSTFQADVMERSLTVPVLIDFWADWCGPCKELGRVLDTLVAEYDGAFVVAKVDSDRELELSQAFQVQSIPFGVLVENGRPVDAFAGAIGEPALREFLSRHGIEKARDEAPDPTADPDSPEGRLHRARRAAAAGDAVGVREALADFPEESPLVGACENLLAGAEFLLVDLPGSPPAAAHLMAARESFLSGSPEDAARAIVDSAREDRAYGGGLARKAMLFLQGACENGDWVDDYRRQLATLLY